MIDDSHGVLVSIIGVVVCLNYLVFTWQFTDRLSLGNVYFSSDQLSDILLVVENRRNLKMQPKEEMYSMKSRLLMNSWLYQILASL